MATLIFKLTIFSNRAIKGLITKLVYESFYLPAY